MSSKTRLNPFALGLLCMVAGCTTPLEHGTRAELEREAAVVRGSSAQRQDEPREPGIDLRDAPELSDYLRYAALNSPALRAAFSRWRAALERVPQARALPDPKLSYTYYIQEVETRVGPQRQKFGLAQTFPWFGKLRLRGDAAAEAAEAAWLDFQNQRLRLFYRVSVLYYDYYYLKQAIDVTQENFDLLRSLEAVARERYRTGQALTAVTQAQVELGKLEDRTRSLNKYRPALAAKLNAALNRTHDAPVPWPTVIPETPSELDAGDILDRVRRLNPELDRLARLAERERTAAELARKDGYPDITLGLTVIDTDDALMADAADSGKDPVMATIGMNLPIWRGKYRAERREALLRRSAWLEQKEARENGLEAEAKLALYHCEDAAQKIRLYRDTLIPKAKQSLGVAQQAFQAGKADFLTLIDAQRVLLEFELAHEQARVERGKRYAELQMLTGAGALREQPEQ